MARLLSLCLGLVLWYAPVAGDEGSGPAATSTPDEASHSSVSKTAANHLTLDKQQDHYSIIRRGNESTLIYKLTYIQGSKIINSLEELLSPLGSISLIEDTNSLVIQDETASIDMILLALQEMDHHYPQIQVQASVVEITIDDDFESSMEHVFTHMRHNGDTRDFNILRDMSINLETPGSDPNTTQGSLFTIRPWQWSNSLEIQTLENFIRLLETTGHAKIISQTSIVVVQNGEGSIITGEDVPIQTVENTNSGTNTSTTFKRVGIKLNVKPLRISGNDVRLLFSPEVSTVTGFTSGGSSGVSNPIVAVRNARTVLDVKDGELIGIGGLNREESRETVRKIPLLGDIPYLGWFFRSTREERVITRLMFFIRVEIVEEGIPHTDRPFMMDLDKVEGYIEDMEKRAEDFINNQDDSNPNASTHE